jgi:hypothetical protein
VVDHLGTRQNPRLPKLKIRMIRFRFEIDLV